MKINKNVIIKINGCYENLNMISDGKISKSKKLQNSIKNILIKKVLKHKNDKKEEVVNPVSPTNQKRRKSFSIKLVKHKTMAKNIPENFKKTNKEDIPLTKEQKEKNYRELILAQIKYDREQREQNLNNLLKNKNRDRNLELKDYKINDNGTKIINIKYKESAPQKNIY